MAKIDFSTRREVCSLIEYCRIYNLELTDFTGDFIVGKGKMYPDLQSQKLNIGIECSELGLRDVFKAMNDKKGHIAVYPTSASSDFLRLIEIVADKTEKLNRVTKEGDEHYNKFNKNVLFLKAPIELYFSNCCDACNPIICKKATNCDNCTNPEKISWVGDKNIALQAVGLNCSNDDCKKYKICTIGEFVRELQSHSFSGKYRYNPIIISKSWFGIGEDEKEFCCWIINTDDYTIVERRGKRNLLESESGIMRYLHPPQLIN
ncbi:MAG: hypothetical protein FWB98_07955 [Defluviitaleaceae bacterium]|nr:hypothetical protein [Defluviitaleaceae bacterium]